MNRSFNVARIFCLMLACWVVGTVAAFGQSADHRYSIEFVDLENHRIQVTARFATAGADTLEIMMPVWSPGYYVIQNYSENVSGEAAFAADGSSLECEQSSANRWRVNCEGQSEIDFRYQLNCQQHSVTTNWVDADYAVLCGCATFVVPVEKLDQPCSVTLTLPPEWDDFESGMDSERPDERHVVFHAPNYDVLVDSPIIGGDIRRGEFVVDESRHVWADLGAASQWNSEANLENTRRIVAATREFWGEIPFDRYVFLNVFRPGGGGGLEHLFSTLLTASNRRGESSWGWLSFVSHEYFHAINVKRLRPVELGPFDYERPPQTPSLWIAEGLTTYFGDLIVVRSGVATQQDYLGAISSFIGQVQRNEGRLHQSLADASLNVWAGRGSGIARNDGLSISYYVKGPVVGFLLDAKIRRATGGKKSLDDVMRLAYKQYAGDRGYTEAEFRHLASSVAGIDLANWFEQAIDQPVELDYSEMLDWYGLRFVGGDGDDRWQLAMREERTPEQTKNLDDLLRPYN